MKATFIILALILVSTFATALPGPSKMESKDFFSTPPSLANDDYTSYDTYDYSYQGGYDYTTDYESYSSDPPAEVFSMSEVAKGPNDVAVAVASLETRFNAWALNKKFSVLWYENKSTALPNGGTLVSRLIHFTVDLFLDR